MRSPLLNVFQNKTTFPESRSVLWLVFSYWMQANKAQLKAKMTWLEVHMIRSATFDDLFLTGLFSPSLDGPKKKDYRKTGKLNATPKWKKKFGVPPMGSEPCLSEPKNGNVATALQGDSLSLQANLTVPIRT